MKFSSAEQKYSTFDRELLSMFLSVKHFKHFLQARPFTIRTDHKPLIYIMNMKNLSLHQQRQISFLSEFSFNIIYLPGDENTVADFLSRSVSSITFSPIFTKEPLLSNKPSNEDLKHFKNITNVDGIAYDTSLA